MNELTRILVSIFIIGLAFYFPSSYGEFEAEADAAKYRIIGAKNSHHSPLFFFNLFKRFVAAVFCVVFISTALWYFAHFHRWFALVYLFYYPAAFGYYYTKTYNEKRGMHRWYVSGARNANRFDKMIRKWAWHYRVSPQDFNYAYHFWYLAFSGGMVVVWIFLEVFFGETIIRIR